MCLFEYEKFQKGQQHGPHFGGDWVDPVLSRDAAVVGAASLSGTGAAGGAGRPWMERRGAVLGRRGWSTWGRRRQREGSGEEGEVATARGRWRGGGGGDGQREAVTRGRRQQGGGSGGEGPPKFGEGTASLDNRGLDPGCRCGWFLGRKPLQYRFRVV
jgi:hypothetical protein